MKFLLFMLFPWLLGVLILMVRDRHMKRLAADPEEARFRQMADDEAAIQDFHEWKRHRVSHGWPPNTDAPIRVKIEGPSFYSGLK